MSIRRIAVNVARQGAINCLGMLRKMCGGAGVGQVILPVRSSFFNPLRPMVRETERPNLQRQVAIVGSGRRPMKPVWMEAR